MLTSWLKKNWQWLALSVIALGIMIDIVRQFAAIKSYEYNFDPLVNSGKWAIRFLLISLAVTPIHTLFGLRAAIPWRKPAGLWAFGFGALHFYLYVFDATSEWLKSPIPSWYTGLGLVAVIVLAAMAATSTQWAQRRMGKWWKRLHRLVYGAGILAVTHGLVESTSSKRVFTSDDNAWYEVMIYIILLAVLLLARVPVVRGWLSSLRHRARRAASPGQA